MRGWCVHVADIASYIVVDNVDNLINRSIVFSTVVCVSFQVTALLMNWMMRTETASMLPPVEGELCALCMSLNDILLLLSLSHFLSSPPPPPLTPVTLSVLMLF